MNEEEIIQLNNADEKEALICKKAKPRVKDFLTYVFGVISIAAVVFCVLLLNIVNDLQSQLSLMKSEIETVATKTDSAVQKVSSFESQINDMESKIMVLDGVNSININSIAGLQMAQEARFYCVTDNFVVEKASFSFNGDGIVDIYTQPVYTQYYKGQGKFNVSDRELKGELLSIVDKVKDVYNAFKKPTMNEFEEIKLTLTIKNYEIGTYENGQIKLKGE